MTDQPDLFAASREDATCGQCEFFLRALAAREGYYCAMSYRDTLASDTACRFFEERR